MKKKIKVIEPEVFYNSKKLPTSVKTLGDYERFCKRFHAREKANSHLGGLVFVWVPVLIVFACYTVFFGYKIICPPLLFYSHGKFEVVGLFGSIGFFFEFLCVFAFFWFFCRFEYQCMKEYVQMFRQYKDETKDIII